MKEFWLNLRLLLYHNMYYIHFMLVVLILYIIDIRIDFNSYDIISRHNPDLHGFWISVLVYAGIPVVLSAVLDIIFLKFRNRWAKDTCDYSIEGLVGISCILTITFSVIIISNNYCGSLCLFKLSYYVLPEVTLLVTYTVTELNSD